MKKLVLRSLIIACLCSVLFTQTSFSQVSINELGEAGHESAMLDVESTNKGFLLPRMTTTNRKAITNPAIGLMIFNTSTNCMEWWNGNWWFNACKDFGDQYEEGIIFSENGPTAVVDVYNPTTGKTWMDRNLGATKVAESIDDVDAYGDLYQWGRIADGHQSRSSETATTLSETDKPGHSNFIKTNAVPNDWRSTSNNNLWQGVAGTNNPCPSGYRIPTEAEFNAERQSWTTNNTAGAIASPLKLPAAGRRKFNDATIENAGQDALYWTSSIATNETTVRGLYIYSGTAAFADRNKSNGYSIRCIKDN